MDLRLLCAGLLAVRLLYNIIFVLRPVLLLAGHVVLGERAEAVLGQLRDRLGRAAREGFLWLLGLVGCFLLADALGHLGIID